MAKVLKINDPAQWEKFAVETKGCNRMVPVLDGNGNLILSIESLTDPDFADMHDILSKDTTVIDYVPLDDAKYAILESQGKINRDISEDIVFTKK